MAETQLLKILESDSSKDLIFIYIFTVGKLSNIFMRHDVNILMLFGIT